MFLNNNIKVERADGEDIRIVVDDVDDRLVINDPLINDNGVLLYRDSTAVNRSYGGFDESYVINPEVFDRDSPMSPTPSERGLSPRYFIIAEERIQQQQQQLQQQPQQQQPEVVAVAEAAEVQGEENEAEASGEGDSGFSDAETLEYVHDDGVDPDYIPESKLFYFVKFYC